MRLRTASTVVPRRWAASETVTHGDGSFGPWADTSGLGGVGYGPRTHPGLRLLPASERPGPGRGGGGGGASPARPGPRPRVRAGGAGGGPAGPPRGGGGGPP